MTLPRWFIEGHAIVSPEGMIADADGLFPPRLGDEADWALFQAALDACVATVLARASHEATPNRADRLRVVMSRGAQGLVRRADAWWWNPADVLPAAMLAEVAPDGGRIGVPGGRAAFDQFLRPAPGQPGFDAFHLATNPDCPLPGGRPVFSGLAPGRGPEALLAEAGLVPGDVQILNPDRGVSLRVWRRAEAPDAAAPSPAPR
ncbi:hypothetical protein P2H44_02460 [Albimonas sp. CAU 1670]|uniref:hypothetical protein n=1 Tax=Albimonas sp. CAU 1670 TaxID=3032599 RepID=UPI0023DC082C|nr:hypothetical protein [Albimonas sp. CAU 1670]MDF2231406.1 hypothetical protein [Albimonas sp. CAU 1670]